MNRIELISMGDSEREKILRECIDLYTKEFSTNFDLSLDQANKRVGEQVSQMFSKERKNSHSFFKIKNDDRHIGYIWLTCKKPHENSLHLSYIQIFSKYQNRGFGNQSLEFLKVWAKNQKYDKISLSVFGDNNRAQAL
jgi:ribosomal protein S18 acetylase RimI-like enzyme